MAQKRALYQNMATDVTLMEESNDAKVKEQPPISSARESGSSSTEVLTENVKSGWLTKRTKVSRNWVKCWFQLKSNTLHYGSDAQNLSKNIPLDGTEIAEANMDNKQFVFRLKPRESRRTYYLRAASQDDMQEWMQAICFAKAASRQDNASQACIVQ